MPAAPVCPVAPVFATANENFLLIVIPSTVTGIVASHAAVILAVVVNVIFGFAVPELSTVTEIPVGQVIVLASTDTAVQILLPHIACASVEQLSPAGAPVVSPKNVYASLDNVTPYASDKSTSVI